MIVRTIHGDSIGGLNRQIMHAWTAEYEADERAQHKRTSPKTRAFFFGRFCRPFYRKHILPSVNIDSKRI
ncbi:hypothetical protein ACLOJK_034116 [Asimina triloba]